MARRRLWSAWPAALGALLGAVHAQPAQAFITAPVPTLGLMTNWATYITLVRVERVDRISPEKGVIVYRKVHDLKGRYPKDVVKHVFDLKNTPPHKGGGDVPVRPDEEDWKYAVQWAQPGRTAVMFTLKYDPFGDFGHIYIDGCWYAAMCPGRDWESWYAIYSDPICLVRWHCGTPAQLAAAVETMLAGKVAVVPVMVQGTKTDLRAGRAKVQGLKVGVGILDYDPKRDAARWEDREFRRITDMPGFTHIAGLPRTGPPAGGVAPADVDGDGKIDVLLYGLGRVALLQNSDGLLIELPRPIDGGARSAEWGDCNGDGKVDLLLATPAGPKLFINHQGTLREASGALPRLPYDNTQAAAWIDWDGDGKPDVLAADGFRGLRLYRNKGADPAGVAKLAAEPPPATAGPGALPGAPPAPAGAPAAKPALPPGTPAFEDISAAVGLGEGGAAAGLRGDALLVADVNADGRGDVLFCAARGVVLINTPQGFVQSNDSGVSFAAGAVRPAFADFDGDGKIDLFIPQAGTSKLLRNDGGGRFVDVTGKAGDLAKPMGLAVCAAWTKPGAGASGVPKRDTSRLGSPPDLLVGCLKGPNRWFRNNGDGTFTDISEPLGLHQRVFNTRGLCVVDLNKDGAGDLVMNNEGQESAVLLGDPNFPAGPAARQPR